jgi:hypothetical protein
MLIVVEPSEQVRELADIDFSKSFDGAERDQQIGLWLIDKNYGWCTVLVALRERKKHCKWAPVRYVLSRWRKEGGFYYRYHRFNLSAQAARGMASILPGACDEIDAFIEKYGDDTRTQIPEVLPGAATLTRG